MRQMPTAAKLVAAVCFAIVAFAAALAYEPLLPESQRGKWFTLASAGIGLWVGWRVMGRMVGGDLRSASRAGVYTIFWLVLWAGLTFSLWEMLIRSWNKRYRTPTEALGNVIEIALYYGSLALNLEVILTLILGGMLAGILSELANRIWR